MRYSLLLLNFVAALSGCSATKGPVGFWSEHRYDAQLRPHGPWRAYYPGPPQKLASREHFRHGRFVGSSRFYTPEGTLERQEKYLRRSYGLSRISYYHPNGRVLRTGQARIVAEPDGAHFYWFGEWQVFSVAGQLEKVEFYENGKLQRVLTTNIR
jgi:antitoxin component YwqK of YwqJK toxin-antitoxin module